MPRPELTTRCSTLRKRLLLAKGLSFSSHSAVNSALGEHFAKTGLIEHRFHRYLLDAEDARTKGDYRTEPNITEAQAAEQIAHAGEFLQAAERLLESHAGTSQN